MFIQRSTTARDRIVLVALTLAVCALAIFGLTFGLTLHASVAFLPVVFLALMVPSFVASTMLFASIREGRDARSVLVLATTFGAIGAINSVGFFAVFLLPGNVAALSISPRVMSFSYVLWHVVELAGVLVYVRLRRLPPRDVTPRFSRTVGIAAAGIVVAGELIVQVAQDRFPSVDGSALHGPRLMFGIVLLLILVASAILAYGLPQATVLDRAVALAQLALTLGVAVIVVADGTFGVSFYCGRALQAVALLFPLAAALRRHRIWERTAVERSHDTALSALSAIRVRTLSELAMLDTEEEQRYVHMLQLACRSIRPGKPMRGTLSHLSGDVIVYDAVAWTGSTYADPARDILYVGASLPLDRAVQGLFRGSGTHAWDDVRAAGAGSLTIPKLIGTRAMIGTAIDIGRRTHFIVFSSPQPTVDEPFSDDDMDYVRIVASFFSTTFEQRQHFEQLRHQMEHDALTGLANRVQFRKAIRAQIITGEPFAVALFNLDGFRHLNEVHGQMVCDELLVEIAYALGAIDPSGSAARLSGDEFGVLCPGVTGSGGAAAMERLLDPFRRPFHTGDREGTRMLTVGASVGCALYPDHGTTVEALLGCADVALAVAKEQGGGGAVLFEMAMRVVLERRRFEAGDIERAIAHDELRLMYQPTFDLRSGAIVGAEALVRWDHPDRGEVLPVDFIPAAERNRLIGPITRWVLGRISRDGLAYPLPPGFRLYFNLSAQDLDDLAFLEALSGEVTRNPRLGEILGVEITETTAMQNVERSLTTLSLIRSLGMRIAIDDFGTGYSSLSYLKRLPVDVIKIDRSFVSGLPGDEKDAALAETMIGICNRLGIVSLAEGIETEAQRAWLADHGCRNGQGYLVARPLPYDELLLRLHTNGVPS